jgi:poly-gamma-glutamate synthesis protein (capsule biosynthesis protein)
MAALVLTVGLVAACAAGPGSIAGQARTPVPATPRPAPTPTPVPQLTLGGLFHPSGPVQGDSTHVRTLIATGDVIPARLIDQAATQRGDFLWPFRPTADYVRNADITYINLESPLLAGCPVRPLGSDFCSDPGFLSGLQLIGTKVANLANNHVYPGPDATQTDQRLQSVGIAVTKNLGPPAVLDVRGLKFAFVGCNAVTEGAPVDRGALQADITYARQLVGPQGVVVVQFHWGEEYQRLPKAAPGVAPDNPVELGHLAIDAGADLVIGNHPHWVQAVEIYKNHLITYAHGNYVFDQVNCYPAIGSDYQTYCSDDTRTSVIGTYTFKDNHLAGVTWRPTYIDPQLQTQFADSVRSAGVLQTMESASVQLALQQGEASA